MKCTYKALVLRHLWPIIRLWNFKNKQTTSMLTSCLKEWGPFWNSQLTCHCSYFSFFFFILFLAVLGFLLLCVGYLLPGLELQLSFLFCSWSESRPWSKIPNTPLCHSPVWKLAKAPFSLFLCPFSFLADLMDNSELIRNVTLCGHLHHGKVSGLLATWNRVALCFCSFFFSPQSHMLGSEAWRLDLLTLGSSVPVVKPSCEIPAFSEQQMEN